MKTKTILNTVILAAAGLALSTVPSQAQNANYAQASGDIVLFFQQFAGSQTVMLNIGTGQTFRDATSNIFDIKNLGAELTTAFGASWYEDSNVYWGVAGTRSNSTNTTAQSFGDPNRTLYVTQERGSVGTAGSAVSPGWAGFSNGDMTTGANGIINMTNRMETVATTDRLVESVAASNVDNQNPFLGANPGTAFGIFPGGVMGNFGAGGFGSMAGVAAEGALDLYRILASTTASGQVGGPLREGTYEGSFVIGQTGDISYIVNATPVPEPTTGAAIAALGIVASSIRRRRRSNA